MHLYEVIRTLTGHKDAAACVQFHPFGDFFASGSADCSVKLWDVRRKGCIQIYSGHKDTVKQLEITPDGRWIASAGLDCVVKIWDMTAGKLLHTIVPDSLSFTPVSSLAFSPSEFIVSVASTDSTIRSYFLEDFKCIAETRASHVPAKVAFDAEGSFLISASSSSLDVQRFTFRLLFILSNLFNIQVFRLRVSQEPPFNFLWMVQCR